MTMIRVSEWKRKKACAYREDVHLLSRRNVPQSNSVVNASSCKDCTLDVESDAHLKKIVKEMPLVTVIKYDFSCMASKNVIAFARRRIPQLKGSREKRTGVVN